MSNNLQLFFQDLQQRGVVANVANLDNFYQLELEPQKKVVYLGIDCTGERLHIGHLFLLIQTIRFAKEGFQILLVLGGATSKIGDPSDKNEERPLLAIEKIENYQAKIKAQIERILIKPKKKKNDLAPLEQFYAENPKLLNDIYQILNVNPTTNKDQQWEDYLRYIWPLKENDHFRILNNKDWLEKMNFIDFFYGKPANIWLLLIYPAKRRLKKGLILDFLFWNLVIRLSRLMIFYYLYKNYNCHGQLGGSDQWGNLTTGLKLIKSFYPENQTFAFNFPLLADSSGKKISKSGSGQKILWLNSEPKAFFDFFRNMPDEQAEIYIKQLTFLSEKQINELAKLNNPPSRRIFQRILYELLWFINS